MARRVLLIGLDPALVDFSRSQSGRTAAQVRSAGASAEQLLAALGYDVESCLVTLGPSGAAPAVEALGRRAPDCVMIGAGLRCLPEHTLLFERIVGAVRRLAPEAALCFNTSPGDTVEAVQRALP